MMEVQQPLANGVFPGRFTADYSEDVVVFLIGARITGLRQFLKAPWVNSSFGEMVKVLYQHPEKGFLGGESFFRLFPVTTLMVQYWRSYDDLERFARDREDPHLETWRRFNKEIGDDGSIGIWHETYVVRAGGYESIYGNMPSFGLAAATHHVPVIRRGISSRERLVKPVESVAETLVK